jgi:hypothetical protein
MSARGISEAASKKKRGRPRLFPVKKLIYLTTEITERIRAYRFDQMISTENEAVRRLIEAGLRVQKPRKKAKR